MNGGIKLSQASNKATAGAASVASHSLLRTQSKTVKEQELLEYLLDRTSNLW